MPEEDVITAPETPISAFATPEFAAGLDKLFPDEPPSAPKPESKPAEPAAIKQPDAKPDAKPADAKPDDNGEWKEIDPPESVKSENGKNSWRSREASFKKKISEETAAREKLLQEMGGIKKDFEELKGKAVQQQVKVDELPEYKTLKTDFDRVNGELEKYSERLRLVAIEQHPKFQEHFDGRTQQALAAAKDAGGDKAVELLKLPPSEWRNEQLEALAVELGQFKGGRLVSASMMLDHVNAERAAELNKARESYKAVLAQEQAATQKQKDALAKTFSDVRVEVTNKEKGLPVFQPRDNDLEWNSAIQKDMQLAEAVYNGELKPEERARAAFWAAASPRLLSSLRATEEARIKESEASKARITELEKLVTDLKSAGAKPGSGSPSSPELPPEKETWEQNIDRLLGGVLK